MKSTKVNNGRRLETWLCWAAIVGCLARVVYAFIHHPLTTLYSDMARHWSFAARTAVGEPKAFEDCLGYQLWLSWIARLTAGTPALTGLYAGMLSAGTVWIWSRLFREVAGRRPAAIATAAVAWFPPWVAMFGYFLMESMVLPLMGLALWMTFRAVRKGGGLNAPAAAWLALGVCRPQMAPLAAPAMIWAWWFCGRPWKQGLQTAGWVFAVVLAMGIRVWVVTGVFAPLGIASQNTAYFWSGARSMTLHYGDGRGTIYHYDWGCPSFYQQIFAPFGTYRPFRSGKFETRIDLNWIGDSWRESIKQAKRQGPGWAPMAIENLVFLFFGETWAANRADRPLERFSQGFRWIWLPLMAVCVWFLAKGAARKDPVSILLLVLLLGWVVVQGLLPICVVDGRFRIAGEGLIVLSVVSMIGAKSATRARRGTG